MSEIDPVVVAKGLSEAMWSALLAASPEPQSAFSLWANMASLNALHRRKLLVRDARSPGAFYSPRSVITYALTPLGLAVREILQEQMR